jgi:hypothetical protein
VGVVIASILWALSAMPDGAVNVPVARHAIVPNVEGGDARGRCAIIQARQLGFVATTVDEGSSWRFSRWTEAARVFCEGDTFLGVTGRGGVVRLAGGDWNTVLPEGGPSESSYRGLESVAGVLYLGTGRQTWTSSDRGATWQPWLAGVGALATDGKVLFVGAERELRRVEAGTRKATPIGKLPSAVTALGYDVGTGALYAGTSAGVHRSRDGGVTWTEVRAPQSGPLPDAPSRFTFVGRSVVVHFEGYPVKMLEPGDDWKDRNDIRAIMPAAAGLWLRTSGTFGHVRGLDDKPLRIGWPDNPFPSVTAIGASGPKLVATVDHVDGVFASPDGGRTWNHLCQVLGTGTAIAIDGDRLQLAPQYSWPRGPCTVPGLRTRIVQRLPQETCNGSLCVRWRDKRLLRTRDRGGHWDDLTDKLPPKARLEHFAVAAAAGHEILLAIQHHNRQLGSELWRSIDDGATFARWDFGETIETFSPGPDGWYLGLAARGLWRVPFGAPSALR